MSTPDRPRRWGRRGLLKGFGASALATSAVVFGTPEAAQAATRVACCVLLYPLQGWSACASSSGRYIWTCTWSANNRTYQCCENYASDRSAYRSLGV